MGSPYCTKNFDFGNSPARPDPVNFHSKSLNPFATACLSNDDLSRFRLMNESKRS